MQTPNPLLITHPLLIHLESCGSLPRLKQLHALLLRSGHSSHLFPSSRLLFFSALSPFASLPYALRVFSQITCPNAFILNTLVRAHTRARLPITAFSFFIRMARHGPPFDHNSFVFALKAAGLLSGRDRVFVGREVHCLALKFGFCSSLNVDLSNLVVSNALVDFYGRYGIFGDARKVFDEMVDRDVFSWTTMINVSVENGVADEGLRLFGEMLRGNCEPNEVTVVAVLSACAEIGVLSIGRAVHRFVERRGLAFKVNVGNSLVDMYGKCRCVEMGRAVFDGMKQKDVFSWTSLVNGYARNEDPETARQVFDEMPVRNVISWSTMISGYVHCDQHNEALDLFHEMILASVEPIPATLLSALSACAQSGRLDVGRWIYDRFMVQNGFTMTLKLANAFMDMFAKCGDVKQASNLFSKMPEKDIVSWNTMIHGYAVHGFPREALSLFEEMKSNGLEPNHITFIGVLSACAHAGLPQEGHFHFDSMTKIFSVKPNLEHYACLIDLLGRMGQLEEANSLIANMPMMPDKAAWGALLSGCRMHGNVELGMVAAVKLLALDSCDSGVYTLLTNLFGDVGRWGDVKGVRKLMRENGIRKSPGRSSLEVEGEVHEFFASDRSHGKWRDVTKFLEEIYAVMRPSNTEEIYSYRLSCE